MSFPTKYKYVVIGAGIHGLSTAYHLALELKNKGSVGSGKDILVIDKSAIGAGASGIACGIIRNNYYQPAMQALTPWVTCKYLRNRCMQMWRKSISVSKNSGTNRCSLKEKMRV